MPEVSTVRLALISDIHANLPALEAVLADIDGRSDVDAVFHLGDLVGYAPWPDATVEVLHERAIPGVAGNYDSTVATDHEHCGCRYEDPRQEELSHASYEWTRAHVSDLTRARLAALPFRLDHRPLGGHAGGPTLTLVHGTPTRNTLYWTEDRPDSFCSKMADRAGAEEGDVLAFGHTHVPWHRSVDGVHFVNVGSVGRPKDGDRRACYALLELSPDLSVELVRVEYDLDRAVRGIRDSGLPDELANYLATGGRSLDPDGAEDGSRAR